MSAPTKVDQPGVYADMPDDVYHADPVPGGSLSSTGVRLLLPPSCPALFRHDRDHGEPHKREYDLGHAAHYLVLGVGPELHVVDADNYLTKKAKTERDEAYARGAVPLLPHEFDTVQAMAAKLREHPRARDVLAPGGVAETSLFWVDPDTGVWCRARLDWLTDRIVDYKTTADNVSPGHISRTVERFSYHVQAAHYLAGAVELDLVPEDGEFVFVVQSKTPPHLVTMVDLDDAALKVGHERVRLALEVYRDCMAADVWPSYSDDIETISLPGWALRAHERDLW